MWWIFFLATSVLAQDQTDLSAIKKIQDELPGHDVKENDQDIYKRMQHRRYRPPVRPIRMEEILASGTIPGSIREGFQVIRLSDDQGMRLKDQLFVVLYRMPDELGYKYIRNKDGTCTYRVKSDHVDQIKEELVLYEPPMTYTPAPEIIRAEYDKKLSLVPEAIFYAGMVQGAYMRDLFNDRKANHGVATQYGVHLATDWKIPIKVGFVFHHESAIYDLTGGGQINYSSWSFGPQFKTRDFEISNFPMRVQTQFRVSPFARAQARTQNGSVDYKFNSADFLTSLEHPMKNNWGNFVLGLFFQSQWLGIKHQTEIVRVNPSNAINTSFGFSLAQVFQ